jgi:hypothetical protein
MFFKSRLFFTESCRKILERVSNTVFITNPVTMRWSLSVAGQIFLIFFSEADCFLNLAGKSWESSQHCFFYRKASNNGLFFDQLQEKFS